MLLEALQKNVMKRSSIFEVVLNTSVSNFLYSMNFTIFGGKRSCFVFITVTTNLWKSGRLVSKAKQFSKNFELLLRNKSIQNGLSTFLKQVASLFIDFSFYWLQNAFIFAPSGSTLKSPINSVFLFFLLYTSNALPVSPGWVTTLALLGSFEFFIKDVFVLIWLIILPDMNNDIVGLLFRFGIKWSINSFVFASGKNSIYIFLLLESFAYLKRAIIESLVINVVPYLHSPDYLSCSISDGFDNNVLFLASLVSVCVSVCVCVCVCVCVSVHPPWRLHLSGSWNTREHISDVELKTFLFFPGPFITTLEWST